MKYNLLSIFLFYSIGLFAQTKIEIISPKNDQKCTNNMPTLAWRQIPCDKYEIWIDNILMGTSNNKQTSFVPFPLSYGQHKWMVKTVVNGVKTESENEVFSIVGKPMMHIPENAVLLRENWAMISSQSISENASQISTTGFATNTWVSTSVPTTALTALVRSGCYPNPYVGMNNMLIPDCSDAFNKKNKLLKYSHIKGKNPWSKPYWFRTEFKIPADFQSKMVWINFGEINYRAELWLNGQQVADKNLMVGMERAFRFDITKFIKSTDNNTLAIAIYPPDHAGMPAPEPITPLADPGDNMADGLISHDYTKWDVMGWDWQPSIRDRDMGITEDVFLSASDAVEIQDLYVTSELALPDTSFADLSFSADFVNHSPLPKEGVLQGTINALNLSIQFECPFVLAGNETKNIVFNRKNIDALHLLNPYLWWPAGYGAQNLYQMKLVAKMKSGETATASSQFGIRKVETYIGKKERVFKINGKEIYCRGGNWVIDMMLNWTSQRYVDEIRLTQNAGLNMLRIWGPTGAPPEAFYDAADKYGVLLWQDFLNDFWGTFKNNPKYTPTTDLFEKASIAIVKKYRNHPSLIIWCGGNEGQNPRQDLLLNTILPKYDGRDSKYYLKASDNDGLHGGGPYHTLEPAAYFKHPKLMGFSSEIGPSGVPVMESLTRFLPDLGIDFMPSKFPLSGSMAMHDATDRNDTRKFSSYDTIVRKYFGDTKSTDNNAIETYVNKCQMVNYDCYRASFESINHQLWETASGMLLWKSNSSWPSLTWQVYDWYLQAHAGYYGAKKACQQINIQFNRNDRSISILNANLITVNELKITANLYNQELKSVWKEEKIGNLIANSVTNTNWTVPQNKELTFLKLSINDKNGNLIAENFYWLRENNDFSDLMSFKSPKLKTECKKVKTETSIVYELTISNIGSNIALMTALKLKSKSAGHEILPSYWSDNYLNLMPGESRKVTVEIDTEIALENLGIECKAMNMNNPIWIEP